MTIDLQLDRIPPGAEVGPHRHLRESVVYVATGELVFEHGESLEHRTTVRAGDVVHELAGLRHRVRNEGSIDVLALLASTDDDPTSTGGPPPLAMSVAESPVSRQAAALVARVQGISRRLIARPGAFGSGMFSVTEVELAPGAVDDWHRHPAAEHAMVVFEGRGTIVVGDVTETLEPLTGIRIEPGRPHRIENTGRTTLRYYVCGSPGTDPLIDRQAAEARRRRDS